MPDASPVKWHLAHTTWFFETFVLSPALPGYRHFDPHYRFLFNSYYEAVGPRWPRPQRGLLSRPTVADVYRYRTHVDEHMAQLFEPGNAGRLEAVASTVMLGLHHEQQHQELILTDLKHAWSANPLKPVYHSGRHEHTCSGPRTQWLSVAGGLVRIGHEGDGFAFDNETPRHHALLQDFQIASRPVSNADYLQFMAEGGYERPEFWLSDGWAARQAHGWRAPLYWQDRDGSWLSYTLAGEKPVDPGEPVCHVSFYEADAFSRWAGARLPTEFEWETAAGQVALAGHFQESGRFHPAAAPAGDDVGPLVQLFGDVWQWTSTAYSGYPGYRPVDGALGEYNGKFMCNQLVLRGASCATTRSHARLTYRNFFPPEARWQFSGIRLARGS
jgi:ergothioneine biosynthesis protein EgtB